MRRPRLLHGRRFSWGDARVIVGARTLRKIPRSVTLMVR